MSHALLLRFALFLLGIIVFVVCYRRLRREWLELAARRLKISKELLATSVHRKLPLPPEKRSILIASLRQHPTQCVGVQVFSFLRFTSSQHLAGEIVSAFRDAGFLAASGNVEGQPFLLGQNKYLSGVWVLGEDRDRIASALTAAGLENVDIDRRNDFEGNCIVIGNLIKEEPRGET